VHADPADDPGRGAAPILVERDLRSHAEDRPLHAGHGEKLRAGSQAMDDRRDPKAR